MSVYHNNLPLDVADVRCVGWLGAELDFPVTGEPDVRLLGVLECSFHRLECRVQRGIDPCPLCPPSDDEVYHTIEGRRELLGISELWLPDGAGGALAAPSMVLHYISHHRYAAPLVFIEAVQCFDSAANEWNAMKFSAQAVAAAFRANSPAR